MRLLLTALFALTLTSSLFAAGGTSQVASPGQKVGAQEEWPKGVAELLNLPQRARGWNGWFTEWPNDVCHYEYPVKNTDEANAVLAEFAKIKAELHVHLSVQKEPGSIGWVSKLDEGNDTAILFTLGDQERLNEWYARLGGGKFGVMEFERAPIAVPPTITIYVRNKAIDLDALVIPGSIKNVKRSEMPGLFHISNLKPSDKPAPPSKPFKLEDLDADTRAAGEKIEKFLAKRREPL